MDGAPSGALGLGPNPALQVALCVFFLDVAPVGGPEKGEWDKEKKKSDNLAWARAKGLVNRRWGKKLDLSFNSIKKRARDQSVVTQQF